MIDFQGRRLILLAIFLIGSLPELLAQSYHNGDMHYPGGDTLYDDLPPYPRHIAGLPRIPGFGDVLTMPCPAGCICTESKCGKEVDCSDLSLSEVPKDLSPETECLDLSMNNITKITPDSFTGLKQLKKLCLSGNFISDLPANAFTGFRKLQSLLLQDNLLESIPPNTISRMPSLKDLNLGANYIKDIHPSAFIKLDSLEHIWLDANMLEEIPTRALSKAPTIKALNLELNDITVIRTGDLSHLSMLKVLLLKHNNISRIESNAFEGATSIQIVDLSSNELTSFPHPIKGILNLENLFLKDNKIETLPAIAFAANPDLAYISLEGNPLRSVSRTSFTGLRHLKALVIEDATAQDEFPDLSGCSELEELSITGGNINGIPPNLCTHLPRLKQLTLSRNRLHNLSGLESCRNLTSLVVDGNQLTKLTWNETKNLIKLQHLDVANNSIDMIDEEAFSNMALQKLNLAGNSFKYLPAVGLRNLQELNITGVRTLLYLPPIELFHSLRSLVAFYPYHCCQLAKQSRQNAAKWSDSLMHTSARSPSARAPLPTPSFPPLQCSPDPGPLTPCDDLLPSMPLRIYSWIAMIASFLLNGLILLSCGLRYCVRRRSRPSGSLQGDQEILRRRENDSPYPGNAEARMMVFADSEVNESRYCLNLSRGSGNVSSDNDYFDWTLCTLAFADVIVTAYTAVILSYDHSTLGSFSEWGAWWQQSAPCHSAGFLLTFGTQLAFGTVATMAIERYLATMHPLHPEKHMKKIVVLPLSAVCMISFATALVTLFSGGGDGSLGGMLPAQNGAACLPWMTKFPFVAFLVGLHVVVCIVTVMFCLVMFCAHRKQSWLSAGKSSRNQVALAVAFNVLLILPLALIALYVSVVMTYSEAPPGHDDDYYAGVAQLSGSTGRVVLDMGRVLAFVMFTIPLRPMLNPVLYIYFNKPLHRDLAFLGRKLCTCFVDTKPRRIQFPPQLDSATDTMYDSSIDVARDAGNEFPLFGQPVFDPSLLQQRTAYDNGGIIASSSVSYHSSSSVPLGMGRPGHANVSSLRSSGRRRRRRSRSRRNERRTPTDTDPTTESEVITFHRAEGAVSYDPGAVERRKKKLSIRYGGVNARDEFQRLVFPKVPCASSSSHGSDSMIYPIMPGKRIMGPQLSQPGRDSNPQAPSTFAPPTTMHQTSVDSGCVPFEASQPKQQRSHYDLSALNSFREQAVGPIPTTKSTPEINNNFSESAENAGSGHEADMEVSKITASIAPKGPTEASFFPESPSKRPITDSTRRKAHFRSKSREEEFLLAAAVRNAARKDDRKGAEFSRVPLTVSRKDSAASHSSASAGSDIIPIGGGSKLTRSFDDCDSAASKDSGIHSEIDSNSGASYSDASIGRRLRFSTGVGSNNAEVSTIAQRSKDKFDKKIEEFQCILQNVNNETRDIRPPLNTEISI